MTKPLMCVMRLNSSITRYGNSFARSQRGLGMRWMSSTADDNEINMLQKLLADAQKRKADEEAMEQKVAKLETPSKSRNKFIMGTFNAISPLGLRRFDPQKYRISHLDGESPEKEPHAILLRSFKLGTQHVPTSVRAIARCGAGVNNIDVEAMTNRGIPVFNTPGANANAVKELVICSLFLSSRGIVPGIEHVKDLVVEETSKPDSKAPFDVVKSRVEKDKKLFGGREVAGKTLGVVGLGHIGASVADAAIALGMEVVGYDPTIGVEAAWRLPGHILQRVHKLEELASCCDYISLHAPYMKETHHLFDAKILSLMRPDCNLINFARGELVDTKALKELNDTDKRTGRYISDFADEHLWDCPKTLIMPHLGASTDEAESNSAEMAANQIMDFIETGSIRNSVNFPTMELPKPVNGHARLSIVNRNVPGMLGLITTTLGTMGINISQHINNSKGDIAYNVVDVEMPTDEVINSLQLKISELEGVISSRMIQFKAEPGFFLVNEAEL